MPPLEFNVFIVAVLAVIASDVWKILDENFRSQRTYFKVTIRLGDAGSGLFNQ